MNYSLLTIFLSKHLGIADKLFELSDKREENEIHNDGELVIYKEYLSKHYFYKDYHYRKNIKQRWKSIVFSIPKEVSTEFFEILNVFFDEHQIEKIDLNSVPEEISHDDGGLIWLLIKNDDGFYRVEIAEKDDK